MWNINKPFLPAFTMFFRNTLSPSLNTNDFSPFFCFLTIPRAHLFKLFTFSRGQFRSLDGMAVREISQIDITRDRNRSVSQLHIPATSTNWKLDAKWLWIDNRARKLTNSWITSGVYRPIATWWQTKTDGQLYDLYPASVAPGRVLGRPVLYQVYADERQRRTIICRRLVGQRWYGNKALSMIRERRPPNRERRRSALSLGGTGHGTALTQTILLFLGETLPVMILQNAVIDNAKKVVISHRK